MVRVPLPPSPVGHFCRAYRVDASRQQETNRHDGQQEHPADPDTVARAGYHDLKPTGPFGLWSAADPAVTSFSERLRPLWSHPSRLSWAPPTLACGHRQPCPLPAVFFDISADPVHVDVGVEPGYFSIRSDDDGLLLEQHRRTGSHRSSGARRLDQVMQPFHFGVLGDQGFAGRRVAFHERLPSGYG